MSDHWDFDEHTLPPKGTIRSVMRRHNCSWRQALKLMGLPVAERVPFGELEIGARFRLNHLIWEKIDPESDTWYGHVIRFTARLVGDDYGDCRGKGARVSIADDVLVEPLCESE